MRNVKVEPVNKIMEPRPGKQGAGRATQKPGNSPAPALAKITPPRLRNVYARERLFQLLDQVADRQLIWLSAPAGSGKTTVVVSWLQARDAAALWYQCDEGDADIASFFHFLSLAAQSLLGMQQQPLPHLSPELYPALTTFVRNYFRELCARLVAPTFIVLDNWQDIPVTAALRELLPIAVNELPAGITLIVVSREQPAVNLSRLQSTEHMAILDWEDLQLTEQETADITARYEPMPGQKSVLAPQELYATTQGWAAGLTVMLRHEASIAAPHWDAQRSSNQAVFNYLSSEIFDRLEASTTEFLMQTACLDYLAIPVAQQLTGNSGAKDILENLVQRNVFTLQHPAAGTYHYHPLFKQFLQSRAAAHYSLAEQRQLLQAAAQILVEQQDTEAAIALLLQAGSWEAAEQLILGVAAMVIQQGRFKTLSDWIAVLPESLRANHAWLVYWQGSCQMAIEFPVARATLEHAYELFVAAGDTLGKMLAVCTIMQHHQFSMIDFSPMVPWIRVMENLLSSKPAFPSPSTELLVIAGFCSTIIFASPQHPLLDRCIDRILQLIQEEVELHSKAAAVATLVTHYVLFGRNVQFRTLAPSIEAVLDKAELGPAVRAQIYWFHAYHYHLSGDAESCHALLGRALELAKHHNLPFFELRILNSRLHTMDYATHAEEMKAGFQQLEILMAQAPPVLAAQGKHVQSMFYLAQGKLKLALQYAETAHAITARNGWVYAHALTTMGLAEMLCELGRLDEATEYLNQCRHMTSGIGMLLFEFSGGLLEAEIARRIDNQNEFVTALAKALAIGRQQGYANFIHGYTLFLFRLIPYALELGIEVEYCQWLIKKRNIKPSSRDIEHWPWPIRIYALGQFKVVVDDTSLEFNGKAQHKPLDLLKALLVQSEGIDTQVLMERLWPDLDGDAARNALDLALHRLRKLLKRKDAIILDQGRLLFDANQVWVDAQALETLCEHNGPHDDLSTCVQLLLKLYRGPFLVDQDQPWTFAARERLRSKFIRCVSILGGLLQEQQHWDSLTLLYRRVIELDPLAEEFHRGLMHGLIAQSRDAEAAAAYLRCKETFARLLGAEPSAPTRAIYARLLKH